MNTVSDEMVRTMKADRMQRTNRLLQLLQYSGIYYAGIIDTEVLHAL